MSKLLYVTHTTIYTLVGANLILEERKKLEN